MSVDDTEWATAPHQTTENLTELCALLGRIPLPERLQALAALDQAFATLHHDAQRHAITDARAQHWPLRRYAGLLPRTGPHPDPLIVVRLPLSRRSVESAN